MLKKLHLECLQIEIYGYSLNTDSIALSDGIGNHQKCLVIGVDDKRPVIDMKSSRID